MRFPALRLFLAAAVAAPVPSPAQTPSPPAPFVVPVGVDLVQVDAVVTDKDGRYVTDLTSDDFEIVEDGKTRAIAQFRYVDTVPADAPKPAPSAAPAAGPAAAASPGPPEPRALAIVIDDLSLDFTSLRRVRDMLTRYVDERLVPGERVSILLTSGGMSNLQRFTDDKGQLKAAIAGVAFNPLRRGAAAAPAPEPLPGDEPVPSASDPAGAAVAAMQARLEGLSVRMERERNAALAGGSLTMLTSIVRALGGMRGRKALMFVSEGLPLSAPMRGSFAASRPAGDGLEGEGRLRGLTDEANRASVVFYTLDPTGLRTYGSVAADGTSGGSGTSFLRGAVESEQMRLMASRRMAADTGGLSLEGTSDLDALVDRVFEDQRGFYLLGFEPVEGTSAKSGLHRVQVKAKRPGLRIRSRRTVYTRQAGEPAAEDSRLIAKLVSPFAAADVPVRLTALFHQDPAKGAVVRSLLHVDAQALTFEPQPDGAVTASVEAAALAIGPRGELEGQAGGTYSLRLGAKAVEAARRGGVVLTLDIAAKPGAYQIRSAARDVASGLAGSAFQFVEVPDVSKGRFAVSGILMSGTDSEANEAPDPRSTPAVRRFAAGERVAYAFAVYNASGQRKAGAPGLEVQVGLVRDGVAVASAPGPVVPTVPAEGAVPVAGALRLAPQLAPGTYTLLVLVRDPLREKDEQDAVQQIDFEVTSAQATAGS